jgi:hypothetical protein
VTVQANGRAFTLSASFLLVLAAVIIFILGACGVHYKSVDGARWTDVGLALLALSFIVP